MSESEFSTNPYAAPEVAVTGADGPLNLPNMKYLGFWPRVLASIIDIVISSIAAFPLGMAMGFFGHDTGILTDVIGWVLGIAYVLVFWVWKSATPGKMIFNAVIVDADTGAKPSGSTYVIRYLGYFPSIIVFGLGLLWVAWDPKKRGWHDMLAGTIVVCPRQGLQRGTSQRTAPGSRV